MASADSGSWDGLISKLLLMDSEMKLALSGADLKEPVRVAFALAPPARVELVAGRLTGELPPVIEDTMCLRFLEAREPAMAAGL
jgi:hypothetical protein